MIVGAQGFIGQRLSSSLRSYGVPVVEASSRDGTGLQPESGMFAPGFSVPKKVRTVIYLAQSPHYRRVPEFAPHVMAVNTYAAVQIAAAAAAAGATRFIYASTGNIYQPDFEPIREDAPLRRDNWYALTKIHAEEALSLLRPRLDITVVRLFSIYGPGQTGRLIPNLVDAIENGREITIEDRADAQQDSEGMQFSFCYIDDTISILSKLIDRAGISRLNIASDETVSIRQAALQIGAAVGHTPVFKYSTNKRGFNLIADVSLLKQMFQPEFTAFSTGISKTLGKKTPE